MRQISIILKLVLLRYYLSNMCTLLAHFKEKNINFSPYNYTVFKHLGFYFRLSSCPFFRKY